MYKLRYHLIVYNIKCKVMTVANAIQKIFNVFKIYKNCLFILIIIIIENYRINSLSH